MNGEDDRLVADVSELLREEYSAACREAHPPAAGVVWFRAERRMRQEAAQAAARPMAVVHALALACAAGVAVALFQFLTPRFLEWDVTTLTAPTALMLALAAVVWLVVAPLALYVALSDD